MKLQTVRSVSVLATIALALPAGAQTNPGTPVQPQRAQGLFTNLAVGLTVAEGENSPLWIRAPGANSGIPLEWNATTFGVATVEHPDFSFAALTRWAPMGTTPRFSGISTGGDVMPAVNNLGVMQMVPNLWCMVSVVCDSSAMGMPGSLLETRRLQGKNPATEIMSYYVAGSTGIHPRFVDTVRIEYTDTQLNLQQALPQPAGPREIVNHDFAMGVNASNSTGQPDPMFPIRDRFYFTLTQASATTLANNGLLIQGEPPKASDIYMTFWDGSQLRWDNPIIAFRHDELFPDRAIGDVEIDALSVFVHPQTGASRAVFSLTPESDVWPNKVYDQLQVYQETNGVTTCHTTALMAQSGMSVTQKQGLRPRTGPGDTPLTGTPDNVDSACIGDPHDLMARSRRMGSATDEERLGKGDFGFTAVRHSPPNSPMDELHIQCNGFDLEDCAFGYVWLHLEGPVGSGQAPIPLGNPTLIDSAAKLRNALDFMIPVPRTYIPLRFSAQLWGVNPTHAQPVRLLRESWVLTVLI